MRYAQRLAHRHLRDCLAAPLTPPADLNQERFESGETSDLNQPGWTLETTRLGEIVALGQETGYAAPSHFSADLL